MKHRRARPRWRMGCYEQVLELVQVQELVQEQVREPVQEMVQEQVLVQR